MQGHDEFLSFADHVPGADAELGEGGVVADGTGQLQRDGVFLARRDGQRDAARAAEGDLLLLASAADEPPGADAGLAAEHRHAHGACLRVEEADGQGAVAVARDVDGHVGGVGFALEAPGDGVGGGVVRQAVHRRGAEARHLDGVVRELHPVGPDAALGVDVVLDDQVAEVAAVLADLVRIVREGQDPSGIADGPEVFLVTGPLPAAPEGRHGVVPAPGAHLPGEEVDVLGHLHEPLRGGAGEVEHRVHEAADIFPRRGVGMRMCFSRCC